MKTKTIQIMYLLAASGLTEREIYESLREISDSSPGYWMDLLLDVRENIRKNRHFYLYEHAHSDRRKIRPVDDSIGDRVEKLLRIEAGLGTSEAVELLGAELIGSGLIDESDIPPLSRKSLSDWVSRLSRHIAAKELLRHATLLRNRYVHGPASDWKLG